MQGPLRHSLVITYEKFPSHLVLGGEVVELNVAHAHTLLSGHFHEPQDHRLCPFGINARHGRANIAQDGELSATIKALTQQHTRQLWVDMVIPDGTFYWIRVEEIRKVRHAAPLAWLATRVRHLLRHLAVHTTLEDFEQHLDILDGLVIEIQFTVITTVLSIGAECLLHHITQLQLLLAVIHRGFLRTVVSTRLSLGALLRLRLTHLLNIFLFFRRYFFFSQQLVDDFLKTLVQLFRNTEGREILKYEEVFWDTAHASFEHCLRLKDFDRFHQEGAVSQQGVAVIEVIVIEQHIEQLEQ